MGHVILYIHGCRPIGAQYLVNYCTGGICILYIGEDDALLTVRRNSYAGSARGRRPAAAVKCRIVFCGRPTGGVQEEEEWLMIREYVPRYFVMS